MYKLKYSRRSEIYTTIGKLSSKFKEFLAEQSQFESDHDHIWQACADRSVNGSYLNKLDHEWPGRVGSLGPSFEAIVSWCEQGT